MNQLVKISANFRGTYPVAGKAFIVASGVLLLLGGTSYYQFS
jgi:hypothetical protein